jgi:U4/U6 small nuclear ribonucleoprotein PRP4
MDNEPSQISKLTSKPRVHFGSLEGQESVKRIRLDETAAASTSSGIDLDALGTLAFFYYFCPHTRY